MLALEQCKIVLHKVSQLDSHHYHHFYHLYSHHISYQQMQDCNCKHCMNNCYHPIHIICHYIEIFFINQQITLLNVSAIFSSSFCMLYYEKIRCRKKNIVTFSCIFYSLCSLSINQEKKQQIQSVRVRVSACVQLCRYITQL